MSHRSQPPLSGNAGTYVDQVRSAPSPKAALAVIAAALDELDERLRKLEAGDDWDSWGEPSPTNDWNTTPIQAGQEATGYTFEPPMGQVTIEQTPQGPVFNFPEPSEERLEERRMLERQQLKLAAAIGDDAGEHDWADLYAKAGPFWLYQHRRDLVMSYPTNVRRQMVADVEQDSPKLAYEMGLDVLKEAAGEPDLENGSGALAVGWVTGKKQ